MLLLYNTGIRLYYTLVWLASFFNTKAQRWVSGRKNQAFIRYQSCFWFHFASLGEFEQGRPVLEAMRNKYPQKKIVVTFFSPSGYEVRKNTALADAVYYLPLDTAIKAKNFISAINPIMAVFTKYEYWYHYFKELHQRKIPLYIISGIFRPKQIFFKWYGSLHRQMLHLVKYFFLQDENSAGLLQELGITNVIISGDTRFDRVWQNAKHPKQIPVINEFKNGHKLLVAGSTWPPDEKILAAAIEKFPDWKFIIAPHETEPEKINTLVNSISEYASVRYSQVNADTPELTSRRVLVVDSIGILSSLYQYANIAYIGGGFGSGIHNTLEAAAFGIPVIFGPEYERFKEARDLITIKAGFCISNSNDLEAVISSFFIQREIYDYACKQALDYVATNTGATKVIMAKIEPANQ